MYDCLKLLAVACLVVGLPVFGIKTCSDWYASQPEQIAERKAKADQIAADKLPRRVNEANGCEVWAFKPGDRWLYFTRCNAKTETTNTWDICRSVTTGKTTRTECTPHSTVIAQESK